MVTLTPSMFIRIVSLIVSTTLYLSTAEIYGQVAPHPLGNHQGESPSSEVAKEALTGINRLEIGHSDYTSAAEVAKELGAQAMTGCASTSCTWNLQIASLRIPNGTDNSQVSFLATFSVDKGRVSKKAFALQIGKGIGVSFVRVSEENDFGRPTGELFKISKQSSNLTPFYRAFIWMDPTLDIAKRERLERFNFDCLDKPEACTDAKSLLPTIDWP